MNNVTEQQLKQIAYMDNAIKNMKSWKQEFMIEKKQHEKRLKRRLLATKNSKPFESKIYMNHLPWKFNDKWVSKKDITDDMVEKETELWLKIYY